MSGHATLKEAATPAPDRAPEPSSPLGRAGLEIAAISFIVLFQELALIRTLPGQVRVLAYFPNLVLISAFLGLGIGSLLAARRSLFWLWPVSLLGLLACCWYLSGVIFTANGVSEHLWLLYHDLPEDAPVFEGVRAPIVLAFALNAVTFVPLGQMLARRLQRYREESSALRGYALDLTGSLAGVVLFSVASFLGTRPVVWFSVVMAAGLLIALRSRRVLPLYLGAAALLLGVVSMSDRADSYSPYYAISFRPDADGSRFSILTNGSLHQIGWGMSRGSAPTSEQHAKHQEGMRLPLTLLERAPSKALVLGAGNGNDVAALLDAGATEIDAVEIDSAIIELGRAHHPDRPYDHPGVRVINTDARSFLNDTDESYDLIWFGTLDSMTRLSALSTVRLDNFVYTREAIRAARSRLAPDGGLVLMFWVDRPHIRANLEAILTEESGRPPVVRSGYYGMLNTVYMAGPAFEHVDQPSAARPPVARAGAGPIPSDDWPYLYLPERGISAFYLSMMMIFMGLAFLAVMTVSKELRVGLRTGGADFEMFFYGLAFLLLETRFVTEMNLVWGATWLTSAVVFGAILATILVGTLLMDARPMRFGVAFAGLLAALAATFFIPTELLVERSVGTRLVLSVLYVGTPIFFASVCFALRFAQRTAVDRAFGWNLLGAVFGGLLEFLSMWVGFKALVIVAGIAYLASLTGLSPRWKAVGVGGVLGPRPEQA